MEELMKKKFPILALLIIAVVFSSCQQNPEPVEQTFTDGKIKVTNNVNRTVYLKLAAIDSTRVIIKSCGLAKIV